MIEKILYYTIDQNDEDKTIIAFKKGKPFFQITWAKPLTKTELKKYAPKVLDRARYVVVRDSILDLCNAMKDMPKESNLADYPVLLKEEMV